MVRTALLVLAALAVVAADGPPPGSPAAERYPQPVRVGDVVGRAVLKPVEAQPVLGRVRAVVRRPDGALALVMSEGGFLGFGTRQVAVPLSAAALLGEYVALMDITPAQLEALPTAAPGAALPPDTTIRMGLVRPFH